ncbi:MAG TPA: putative toxin-antitoxin system toxin component, PIN family [Terracidiphilus sp.]|nr:putative toxin-antitoxin system toxin component, PIN family [Terracidiphilus sp.]
MAQRIVIDTCVYVSGFLYRTSVPRRAIDRAWAEEMPLLSEATWEELSQVLRRAKIARYVTSETTQAFLDAVWNISELVPIPAPIRACRDPRDDKFLELAVHGRAGLLITGDADLLALNPFRSVTILTPADFLRR